MNKSLIIPDIPVDCKILKLDVGLSNEAVHSSVWLHQQPDLFVFGFEPLESAVKNLMSFPGGDARRLQRKHKDRIHIYNVALDNVDYITEREFYINDFDTGCSSFYKPRENTFMDKIRDVKPVPVWGLWMFFERFFEKYPDRFECIHHIKIDAQGADLDIAKGAKHFIKEKVAWITLEGDGGYYQDCGCFEHTIDEYMIGELAFERVKHPRCQDPTYLNPKFAHLRNVYIMQDGQTT
jgi:hypothetical protein